MTDRPTLETDAVFRLSRHLWSYTLKETCRRLERERDEANEALAKAQSKLDMFFKQMKKRPNKETRT